MKKSGTHAVRAEFRLVPVGLRDLGLGLSSFSTCHLSFSSSEAVHTRGCCCLLAFGRAPRWSSAWLCRGSASALRAAAGDGRPEGGLDVSEGGLDVSRGGLGDAEGGLGVSEGRLGVSEGGLGVAESWLGVSEGVLGVSTGGLGVFGGGLGCGSVACLLWFAGCWLRLRRSPLAGCVGIL